MKELLWRRIAFDRTYLQSYRKYEEVYTNKSNYMYTYICIKRERERERETETDRDKDRNIEREREKEIERERERENEREREPLAAWTRNGDARIPAMEFSSPVTARKGDQQQNQPLLRKRP